MLTAGTRRPTRTGSLSICLSAALLLATSSSLQLHAADDAPAPAPARPVGQAPAATPAQPAGDTPGTTSPGTTTTATAEAELSADAVNAWIQEIEQDASLSAADRMKAVGLYRQILADLARQQEFEAAAKREQEAAAAASDRVQSIRQEIAQLPDRPNLEPYRETPLAELQQAVTRHQQALAELRSRLTVFEAEPARRVARRREIRGLLAAQPERIAEVQTQLKTPAPVDEPAALATARRRRTRSRLQLLEAEGHALKEELQQFDAADAVDLVQAERDVLKARIRYAEDLLAALRSLETARRRTETEARLRQAREQLSQQFPGLRQVAGENQQLAEQARTVNHSLEEVASRLEQTRSRLDRLTRQYTLTREKVATVGLTEVIGQLLRKQKESLPDPAAYRNAIRERQQDVRDAQLAVFRVDEDRSELSDVEVRARRLVEQAGEELVPEEREQVHETAIELLTLQRELLDTLAQSYNRWFDDLISLDAAEQQLIEVTVEYGDFIDERVLWIQSEGRLTLADFPAAAEGVAWLLRPQAWRAVAESLRLDAVRSPGRWVLAIVLLIVWTGSFRRMRNELRQRGIAAARSTCQAFLPTVRSCLLTLGLAMFWPAVIGFVGWRLQPSVTGDNFTASVGAGLLSVAVILLPLQLLRQVSRSGGLGAAHFGWPSYSLLLLKRYLRVLAFIALPLIFVSTVGAHHATSGSQYAMARVSFILALLATSWCLKRLLQPASGVLKEHLLYQPGGLINRTRYLWYPLAVLLPASLAAISVFGYGFTAGQLVIRLFFSLVLILGCVLLGAFLRRWLLIGRRRIAIRQARQRAVEATSTDGTSPASPVRVDEEQGVDLSVIDAQTRKLLNTAIVCTASICLWLTWIDTVPALRILDRVELWNVEVASPTEQPEGLTLPATGGADAPAGTSPAVATAPATGWRAVTLGDVSKAVLVAVLMIVAVRNLPGLLEMALLRHLPIDAAGRFAVTTLTSYAIIVIGLLLTFGALGVGWAKVQWLAAALTLGVGFGLQEIFANFVSGLIILVERPVRVGDVVTIDDVTGMVSRIRIRATTITGWDRKELIVPNREFITGRLLNWTLTDAVNRITITVGVAYGSDTERARSLLLEQALNHPDVLREPPPVATFEQFGDSTLNFVLRVYLPRLDQRLTVIHDLHTRIDQAFRAANIEIAFPQRDLHIRTSTPLAVTQPPPSEALSASDGNGQSVEVDASRQDAQQRSGVGELN